MLKIFTTISESIPKDVSIVYLPVGKFVCPVCTTDTLNPERIDKVETVFASAPVLTASQWFTKTSDIFPCPSIRFRCNDNSLHGNPVAAWADPTDLLLIRLTPFLDNWNTSLVMGFILFAQDLTFYR